jgi:hypothetical protein
MGLGASQPLAKIDPTKVGCDDDLAYVPYKPDDRYGGKDGGNCMFGLCFGCCD